MTIDTDTPTILHVEDDFVDAEILRRAIRKRGIDAELVHARDGGEALCQLRSGPLQPIPKERVVMLVDVNMPGMNGHQLLAEIRADDSLNKMITFMLSTSDHATDIAQAKERAVAGYFLKSDIDALLDAVEVCLGREVHTSDRSPSAP